MTKIHNIFSALTMLMLFSACQSESLIENSEPDTQQPVRKLTVKASLSGEPESRAHIVYGYGEHGTDSPELFRWSEEDEIVIVNLSKLSDFPYGEKFKLTETNGNTASFSLAESSFKVEAGDRVIAFYSDQVDRKYNKKENPADAATFDSRNIFNIVAGTEANKPQYIESNPAEETALSYMESNLKMYDIVVADKDDEIPDIHFKHLCAIFRVTLHNESGHDIYPTKLEVKYPTTSPSALEGDAVDRNPSFFNTVLYCSVEEETAGVFGLKVYDTDEFFGKDQPYTCNIGTTINGKEGTADAGESIPNGSTYELYLSTMPRIDNDSKGDEISIDLIENHVTENPYILNLKGFDVVIEPGKRYWFNVTATPDHKLVLTSQYNPDDYKQTTEPSEPTEE